MVSNLRNLTIIILISFSSVYAFSSETQAGTGHSVAKSSLNPLPYEHYKSMGYMEIKKASEPIFPFDDTNLLLSYEHNGRNINISSKTPSGPKLVAVAFEFENYKEVHPLSRNEHEVYFLLYDIGRKNQQDLFKKNKSLQYRLIVDGVWMSDPQNKNIITKANGITISEIPLSKIPKIALMSPEFMDEKSNLGMRSIRLNYQGKPNEEVYLAASFNSFDPYVLMMKESRTESGLYYIDLKLRVGTYYYYFVVDGIKMNDPLNKKPAYGKEDFKYSRIDVLDKDEPIVKKVVEENNSGGGEGGGGGH